MGQDKKQLSKLLAFIKELYDNPDNKDFAAGIQNMVLADKDFQKRVASSGLSGSDGTSKDIQKIERYLSLDFKLDEANLIDYSFITNEKVHQQLLSDYREMLRYQFGTRSHKVDFLEFCRFAHLQTEMLINYYFETVFQGDFGKMVAAMKANYSELYVAEKANSISDISLKSKLFYLTSAFGWDTKDKNAYLNVYEARNRQSHRSLKTDRDLISVVEQLFKDPAYKKIDGTINYAQIAARIGQNRMSEYWFQTWFERQPYEEISMNLKKLAAAIELATTAK